MGVSTGELQVSRKIDANICELTIFIDLSDVPWYTFKQVSQASQVSKKKTSKDSTVLRQTPAFLWVFLENERLILGLSKSGTVENQQPHEKFRDRWHHSTNIHHLPTNPLAEAPASSRLDSSENPSSRMPRHWLSHSIAGRNRRWKRLTKRRSV